MNLDMDYLPFRLRVLMALTDVIKGVTPANGYYFDLSDYADEGATMRPRVFRGREEFGEEPLPIVSILEHPTAVEAILGVDGSGTVAHGDFPLLLQGFVEDDPVHPTDPAHVLAAEVVMALAKAGHASRNILGFGYKHPCVLKIQIGSPVVRPPMQAISDKAFFYLPVTLKLVEDLENPFT